MDSKRFDIMPLERKGKRLSLVCSVLLCCLVSLPIQLQAQPSVETLMSKGDSCRDLGFFNKALSYYMQAYVQPSVAKKPERHMLLLERIMRSHYMLCHWKEMPETSYQLYHLARPVVWATAMSSPTKSCWPSAAGRAERHPQQSMAAQARLVRVK